MNFGSHEILKVAQTACPKTLAQNSSEFTSVLIAMPNPVTDYRA